MSKLFEIFSGLFELIRSGFEFFRREPMTAKDAFEFFAKYGNSAFDLTNLMKGQPSEQDLQDNIRHAIYVCGQPRNRAECAAQLIREFYAEVTK